MRGDALSQQALNLAPVESYGLKRGKISPPLRAGGPVRRTVSVSTDDLYATQFHVIPAKIDKMPDRTPGNRPTVVRRKGQVFVLDGHHRVARSIRDGKKTIRVDEYVEPS